MKNGLTMKNSQRGFIGSIVMLATIIGLVVMIFAGRVVYNKFTDNSEIFSFSMFDHTFKMTQEQSLKSKIKDGINSTIDGIEKGAKDAKDAAKEVLDERGVNDALKDLGKQSKELSIEAKEKMEVVINGNNVDISEKDAKNIAKDTMSLMSSVFEGISNSVEDLKKE